MRNGLVSGLENDVLGEGLDPETGVVDGDSIIEEISAGNEDIIPDDYTEIDGGMTTVENISDAIENEEVIIEEVEKPLLTEGTESDFNKTTLMMLQASNMKLNKLLGVSEARGVPTAGLLSNVSGGYKAAFEEGLEAKEGFLKTLKAKAAAGFTAMLEAIKKFIQKALIYFNGAGKSAESLISALDKKKELSDKADKLTDSDKSSIANKFGAWIAMGGKISDYEKYANELAKPAVPEASKKVPLRSAGLSTMPLAITKALGLEGKDEWSILNLTGKTAKFLVLYTNYKAATRDMKQNFDETKKANGISLALDAGDFVAIEVKSVNTSTAAKDVKETAIPSIDELMSFAKTTKKLADQLKTIANKNYDAAASFKTAIAGLKEDEASKGKALERVSQVATRAALENVGAYMSAMKTMLWFSSTFAKRYKAAEAAK